MDRRALLFLSLAVIAAGCTHVGQDTSDTSAKGLEIESLGVSDQSLAPGQSGVITLQLRNYHRQPVDIQDVSLYNTGILDVEEMGCSPSELEEATGGYTPGMECKWRASIEEGRVSFESRTIPVKLNLEYSSQLSNSRDPLKVHFMPLEEIERTSEVRKRFSNGEVEMEIVTESPMPMEGRTLQVTVEAAGNGRVSSDYSFDYSPRDILSCPDSPGPVVGGELTFSCDVNPQQSSTRNLVFSTSYKYVKAPTLDVEVVNR